MILLFYLIQYILDNQLCLVYVLTLITYALIIMKLMGST